MLEVSKRERLAGLARKVPAERILDRVRPVIIPFAPFLFVLAQRGLVVGQNWFRAQGLAALAPRLPEEMRAGTVKKALRFARTSPPIQKAVLMATLSEALQGDEQVAMLKRALAVADSARSGPGYVDFFKMVSTRLPDRDLPAVLARAKRLESEDALSSVIGVLAPRLRSPLDAWPIADRLQDPQSRSRALTPIAVAADDELPLVQAFEAGCAPRADHSRPSKLSPHRSPPPR